MRIASVLRGFLVVAAVAAAASAHAAVPSAARSIIPDCIPTAIDGILMTRIVVRDFADNAVGNSVVFISYADCPEFQPCPTLVGVDSYTLDTVNKRFVAVSDVDGKVIVYLRGGGGCATHPFQILADGVPLGARREASDDQNGDHVVDATDIALITSKVGTSDLTGDLTCDGVVDGDDVSIVQSRNGTICEGPVPARPQSWGSVKILYR